MLNRLQRKSSKAQTALEYLMVLAVIILPLAAAINEVYNSGEVSQGGGDAKKVHMAKAITYKAIGSGSDMGVIGRPYP